jgi:hypothetical protein
MNTAVPCWALSFFPYATFGEVPVTAVRDALRQQFTRWGLPTWLRVDNGVPWGNGSDLPTAFALWGIGVGIRWHWNDPCSPTQNPKIERSQGTGQRWGDAKSCATVAELQANLDDADSFHREKQRVPKLKKTRWELFPALQHSGRKYTLAWEERHWNLAAVEAHLSEYVAVRRVYASGHVSVYDRGRYVGKQYEGQNVQVQYDPDVHGWIIRDAEGREIRCVQAPEINRTEIHKMSFRKPRQKK